VTWRQKILDKLAEVEALPASSMEALRLIRDPEAKVQEIVRRIELDPALTSNLLRVANSAAFGAPQKIRSLRDVVVRLGSRRVGRLVAAAVAGPALQVAVRGYDLPPHALWEHSVATALCAENLAESLGLVAPDYLFTAALLIDVGKIVMGSFLEVDAEPIKRRAYEGRTSFEEAERAELGIDHPEVGASLLQRWGLPECVTKTVRWSHDPEPAGGDIVTDLTHVANILCMTSGIGAGVDGLNYRPSPGAVARLGVKTQLSEKAILKTLGALADVRDLFLGR